MKPITFKGVNTVYAKDQPEYMPLPCYKRPNDELGSVTLCWNLSFKERIKVLFTGNIWQCMLTFNKPLTPQRFSVNKEDCE